MRRTSWIVALVLASACGLAAARDRGPESGKVSPAATEEADKLPRAVVALDDAAKRLGLAIDKSGEKDASAALRTVIEGLPDSPTYLDVSPGTYRIATEAPLKSGVVIRGPAGGVTFRRDPALAGDETGMFGSDAPELHDFGFSGVVLDGDRRSDDEKFFMVSYNDRKSRSSGFQFVRSEIRNFSRWGHGIHMKGVRDVAIRDSTFRNGGAGFFHSIYLLRTRDSVVTGSKFIDVPSQGVKFSGQPGNDSGGLIADNYFESTGRAINVADWHDLTIRHNVVRGSRTFCIHLGSENGETSDIRLEDNELSGCEVGVGVKAHDVAIEGGSIRDSETAVQVKGRNVRIDDVAFGQTSGSKFRDFTFLKIDVGGGSGDVSVRGNSFDAPAGSGGGERAIMSVKSPGAASAVKWGPGNRINGGIGDAFSAAVVGPGRVEGLSAAR